MSKFKAFLKRKDIEITLKRYGIDALSAMAQGLFCSLLIGTILNTLGQQFHIGFLTMPIFEGGPTIGGVAMQMVGPAMAVAIGYALHAPAMVLFSLVPVGFATNAIGGAGGPLAVLVTAVVASEFGKMVSKETKVDILVTPIVTILVGVGLAMLVAAPIGKAASWVGQVIMWATQQRPFIMGILVSVIVGVALTLPISSAAICAALSLTGLAGGAAVAGCCANMIGFAFMSFKENRWGGLVSQGPQSEDLDPADRYLCHHRPDRHLRLQARDERRRHQLRHGNLRPLRPHRRLDRLGFSERGGPRQRRRRHAARRHRLDRPAAHRHRPARRHLLAPRSARPQDRLDQRG